VRHSQLHDLPQGWVPVFHGVARIEAIENHRVGVVALPTPQILRDGQMDSIAIMIRPAGAIKHPVSPAMADDVRGPYDSLAGRGIGVQDMVLLLPWRCEEVRRGCVRQKALVEWLGRFGMGDSEHMPEAVPPLEEAMIIDIPLFFSPIGGVVDFGKGTDPLCVFLCAIPRFKEMPTLPVSDLSYQNSQRSRRARFHVHAQRAIFQAPSFAPSIQGAKFVLRLEESIR
jgi:hypothetical protein